MLPLIFSVVLIRYYSSMAGLSPARGVAYTPAVRTQPDHASSYHCLHATPPANHTSPLYAVPPTTATAAAARHSAARCAAGRRVIARRADTRHVAARMLPLACCRSTCRDAPPEVRHTPRTADGCHRHSPHSHALATATVSSSYHCRPNVQQR